MSIERMTQVLGSKRVPGIALPRSHREVLLVLADHAHDDGSSVRPGIDLIAYKSQVDERHVRRVLRCLERCVVCGHRPEGCGNPLPIIAPVAYARGGHGRATQYQLYLDRAPKLPPFDLWKQEGGRGTPLPAIKGGHDGPKGGHFCTKKGGACAPPTITNHQEPASEFSTGDQTPTPEQVHAHIQTIKSLIGATR